MNRLALQHAPAALQMMADCMNDAKAPWSARLRAGEIILDRSLGKPKTNAEVNITGEVSVQHQHLVAVQEIAAARLAKIAASDSDKQSFAEDQAANNALLLEHEPGYRASINNAREAVPAPAQDPIDIGLGD